jgi:branched-chain amino acid transport system substrate-binding protein
MTEKEEPTMPKNSFTQRARLLALAVAAVLALAPSASRSADTLEVPVILAISGPLALVGQPLAQSLEALQRSVNATGGINGRQLQFTILDDASNLETTVQLANQLINKKVPLFLGPTNVASCRAVAPLVTAGPLQYCFSPGGQTTGYSYASGYSTPAAFATAVEYFHALGYRRFAVLDPTDATGQDGDRSLAAVLALPAYRDITVVAQEHYNIGDISVAAQLSRIKAANPQVLFAWATGTPIGNVLRNIRDGGIDLPIFTSHGNLSFTVMKQFGDLVPPSGLYFAGPLFLARELLRGPARNGVEAYVKGLDAVGLKPDGISSLGWDAGTVVVDALRHVPNPTADSLRAYIDGIHGLGGSAAVFDFRDGSHRGISASGILIAKWNPQTSTFIPVSQPGGKPLRGR